jgi:hypothetical protein
MRTDGQLNKLIRRSARFQTCLKCKGKHTNPLKPDGYNMYHVFDIKSLCVLPARCTSIYVYVFRMDHTINGYYSPRGL